MKISIPYLGQNQKVGRIKPSFIKCKLKVSLPYKIILIQSSSNVKKILFAWLDVNKVVM